MWWYTDKNCELYLGSNPDQAEEGAIKIKTDLTSTFPIKRKLNPMELKATGDPLVLPKEKLNRIAEWVIALGPIGNDQIKEKQHLANK